MLNQTIRLTGIIILALASSVLPAQPAPPPPDATPTAYSSEQLDKLVAPIALYPDQLLPQVLMAAARPLELFEANQWLRQNRSLQGLALLNAAQSKNWDTSVQVLLLLPDVLGRLASNIRWTTALGDAFLAQRDDVLSAVQRVRARSSRPPFQPENARSREQQQPSRD